MKNKRGDTIVEVVFGFAIFGFIAMSILLIMRNGMAKAQSSLEISLVRNQMDAQAEALRFIHQAALTSKVNNINSDMFIKWQQIKKRQSAKVDPISSVSNNATCKKISDINSLSFVLDTRSPKLNVITDSKFIQNAITYSRLEYQGTVGADDSNAINLSSDLVAARGIWIEAKKFNASGGEKAYYDFYIRSCWNTPSSSNYPATLETIVRLYDFE